MRLPRLTTTLFIDLAIWMIGFGLLMGIIFPFFILILGLNSNDVLSTQFFAASISAGLFVGTANYLLARWVVRPRLQRLSEHTRKVEAAVRNATYHDDWENCTSTVCQIPVDSRDEIGESISAFNDLVDALLLSHEVEAASADFAHSLSRQLELNQLANHALERILSYTDANAGAVLIERMGELVVIAQQGLTQTDQLITSEPVRRCLTANSLVSVILPVDIMIDAVMAHARPREVCLLPLTVEHTSLGLFLIAKTQEFTFHARRMMHIFQQSFSLALNNALAHEHLQTLAAIDALTGAYNRRFGLTRLNEEFQRTMRLDTPLGIMVLDLDHFKTVNDTHGHLAGDRVLARVAETIRGNIRTGDILVRYGGEEFLLILPSAPEEACRALGERLRCAVAELRVNTGQHVLHVTVSIGLSVFPNDEAESTQQLIQYADEALYLAKHNGRNRLVRFGAAPVVSNNQCGAPIAITPARRRVAAHC
ncbi:sensor domain-containing diguanylate cyclase [Thiospirillum jenense]|uniref:diguanylate cyclase n=1 Tax=Thiospirillum jenense TaxID=1653858 RepID=A0A839HJB0_9GAMM|nr:sensor domain-containing diguanylate cyclase [Thiospirillum jenense]MBB1126709.1 sensor domain-containing diguanylate cyclase [Thiospirillum jenense]